MTQSSSFLLRMSLGWCSLKRRGHRATVFEGQVAHLQASKIERVRDASGSGGGRADVVDCGHFSAGELDLDCEVF